MSYPFLISNLKVHLPIYLARPSLWRWAAPVRSLRQLLGLQPHKPALGKVRHILVVRPDEIGDIVLTSSLLRELRRAAPQASITLLVKKSFVELVEYCPYVDEIIPLNFGCGSGPGNDLRLWLTMLLVRLQRHFRGFDLVLLPRRDADWYGATMAAHLIAGHGCLLAHKESIVVNSMSPLPLPNIVDEYFSNSCIEHDATHNLSFLRWLGVEVSQSHLELWLTESDRDFARDWIAKHFPQQNPLIALHPSGGRSPLKQWPQVNFLKLHTLLLSETSYDFLVIGGAEENWIKEFPLSSRTVSGVGQFTLRQLAAVLAECDLFIGCDSGPMHIAAAMGTPVIAIYGASSEIRFRPVGPQTHVLSLQFPCSPDQLHTFENRCQSCLFDEPLCLTNLSVKTVIGTVRAILSAYVQVGLHCE